jgi:DNA-directed RNA polymerase subunit RPC12/RpoP
MTYWEPREGNVRKTVDKLKRSHAEHVCVLCGTTFVGWGHNPEPLASLDDGLACERCNTTRVVPARLPRP